MGTKFKINKNILLVIVCFCVSVITFRLDSLQYLIKYHTFDFYNSNPVQGVIYEIGTNSVYTVVGDSASEKMLNYKKKSNEIIDGYKSIDVFVINNNSKKTYSNDGILSLSEFNKKIKNYPYILEINFKDNTMKRIENSKKVNFRLKNFGNISKKRKEDVTTYIAIPSLEKIRTSSENDSIYYAYKQFVGYNIEFILTVGSKIIAGITLLIILIKYIICLRKLKNNKENYIISRLEGEVYEISKYSSIYNQVKNSKIFKIETMFIINILLYSFSQNIRYKLLYILINTLVLLSLYYLLRLIILGLQDINNFRDNSIIMSIFYKKDDIQRYKILVIKYKILWIIFTVFEVVLLLTIYYIIYGRYEHGDIINYISDFMIYQKRILLMLIGLVTGNIAMYLFICKQMNRILELEKGINEFKNGNFNYKIESNKNDMFEELINDVNLLGEVINKAVEDSVKSERMKTELITNVSHDLKTPLTAIINYVSLMKKEDIKPEYVKDYVTVLDKKTQKLKILIDDLFEAAKISSNDIEINLEKTDINQLLMQSIVELDDDIKKVNLDFITNVPQKEVYILGDGKKLWRVFENLILNVTKYSLKGTRVYIDMIEEDDKVVIIMKNISKYPLNFDSEEITERFTRGDLSRNTEGSGLGLSIAKGFVEAQEGNLHIDILGDLFIVNIEFDLYEK